MAIHESQRPTTAIDDEQSFGTSGTTGDPNTEEGASGNGGYPVMAPETGAETPKTDPR